MERKVLQSLVGLVALAIVLFSCGPLPTAPPLAATSPTPRESRLEAIQILFVREGDIYKLESTTGQTVRLTQRGDCRSPHRSPDGRYIALVCGKGTEAEIYRLDADGRSLERLTQNAIASAIPRWSLAEANPQWSPDGVNIAYVRILDRDANGQVGETDEREVWLIKGNGEGERRLAAGYDPAWSPDGERLAYATNGELFQTPPYWRNNAIHLVGVRGEESRRVVGVGDLPRELRFGELTFGTIIIRLEKPCWSPDGSAIAFAAQGHSSLVASADLAKGEVVVYDDNYEGNFGRVTYSPDGQYLAYESLPATGWPGVTVLELSSKRKVSLGGRETGLWASWPTWAPDGSHLAFVGAAPSSPQKAIYLATRDGASVKPISSPGQKMADGEPVWAP